MKKRAHGEGSIFRRKDGRWQAALTFGYGLEGQQARRTVYGKTQTEVREKLEELRRKHAGGLLADARLTLGVYLDRWLEEKKRQVKPRTHESYGYTIEKYLRPRLGRVRLDKLTPMRAQLALGDIADTVGPRTSNLARSVLFASLRQAVRWRLLPYNPVEGVMRAKEEPREMTLWTPEQAVMFLDHARSHRLYGLFYLALSAGLRCGELLGLQWRDLKGNMLHIERTLHTRAGVATCSSPKTDRGRRRVALAPDMLEVLSAHGRLQESERLFLEDAWPETGHVFTSEVGTLLNGRNVTRVWHRLQLEAGVPRARLHDARHLHVSLLVRSGVDVRAIADRVGHSDPSFTLRQYSHMFEEQRVAAAVSLLDVLPMRGEKGERAN